MDLQPHAMPRAVEESVRLSVAESGFVALCLEEVAHGPVDVRAVCRGGDLILRFRDTGRLFDPTQYIRQFRAAPQDPAKNVGLRIVSGTAAEMRYITLLDCNIVILRFSGSDETFS